MGAPRLQETFELRGEESIKFRLNYADKGDYVDSRFVDQGSRPRTMAITTSEQHAVLDLTHKLVGAGSLIPGRKASTAGGPSTRTLTCEQRLQDAFARQTIRYGVGPQMSTKYGNLSRALRRFGK